MNISAELTGVEVGDLKHKGRGESLVLGRMVVVYWMNVSLRYTRRDISKVFCRDRSTVYYYCRRFEELLQINDSKAVRLQSEFMNRINR